MYKILVTNEDPANEDYTKRSIRLFEQQLEEIDLPAIIAVVNGLVKK